VLHSSKETQPGASERQIRTDIESCSEAPVVFTIFVLLPEDTVLNITIPTCYLSYGNRQLDDIVGWRRDNHSSVNIQQWYVHKVYRSYIDEHASIISSVEAIRTRLSHTGSPSIFLQTDPSIPINSTHHQLPPTHQQSTMPATASPPKIPSIANKVLFITGGTAGLGRQTLLSLAAHSPSKIYFSGRSQSSATSLITELAKLHPNVPCKFIRCDLASLSSIKTAAQTLLAQEERLDLFFANAGVMALPPGLTEDGYEVQFGTNHLGHAALVKLLLPVLRATAGQGHDVRVIWNTSLGYRGASGIDFAGLKTMQACLSPIYVMSDWFRYSQSKLANLLYARELAKRFPEIMSVAVHPGVAETGLVTGLGAFNRWFVWATTLRIKVPIEECAWNQQWAAVAPRGEVEGEVVSGEYYEPVGVKGDLTKAGGDDKLAKELWEWTERELEAAGI
jgi:NAD(P)-dependent dehydrogenase (short-subunit alcohol dehydrogenase family)